jgi:hypothetical protein
MSDQETKLEEIKFQLQDSKNKGLIHDDEEEQILDKISKLEITMKRVNAAHGDTKKRYCKRVLNSSHTRIWFCF